MWRTPSARCWSSRARCAPRSGRCGPWSSRADRRRLGSLPGDNASGSVAINERGTILGSGNVEPYSIEEFRFQRAAAAAALSLTAIVTAAAGPAAASAAEPGRIATVVRDGRTGVPVAGVTVHAVSAEERFGDLWDTRSASDTTGTVVFVELAPGRCSFFVEPSDPAYGMQWPGVRGGTGDRDAALVVVAPDDGIRTLPDVPLDPAGAITGTFAEARTGTPVTAQLSVASMDPLWRETTPNVIGTGRYTFTALGPYRWKLFFMPDGTAGPASRVAAQWSGGATDRRQAARIQVLAGHTTVADRQFRTGTVVSGNAVGGTPDQPVLGPVYAFHASTHEIMAVSDDPGSSRYAVRPPAPAVLSPATGRDRPGTGESRSRPGRRLPPAGVRGCHR